MKQILLFSTLIILTKASIWSNLTANIAVVEFQVYKNESATPQELIDKNLENYIKIFEEINKNQIKLDLIVFPELSLGVKPETSAILAGNSTPCTLNNPEDPEYLKKLSCLAIEYETYLVTNIVEKSECGNAQDSTNRNCKNTGFYFYNTNIVFDRKGSIITTYRKYNLFGEWALDMPIFPQVKIFETDFGAKFGIFTCFDILFKSPAENVASNREIDGVIYPAYWHSELPFLTALQAQQMWSYGRYTRLFAAGGNRPEEFSGGSGIYKGGQGTFADAFVADGGSKILYYKSVNGEVTAEAPNSIDELSSEMDSFPFMTDDSLKNYTVKIMDTSKTEIQKTLCHKNIETEEDFCCNFVGKLSKTSESEDNSYTYFFLAFSGKRTFGNITTAGLEVCSIVACLNSTISSCGLRFPKYEEVNWPLTFEELTVNSPFDLYDNNKRQFPNSLLSSIRPIDATEATFGTLLSKNSSVKYFTIKKPQTRILTFGIYGRNFAEDSFPDRDGTNSVQNFKHSVVCLILTFTAFLILY